MPSKCRVMSPAKSPAIVVFLLAMLTGAGTISFVQTGFTELSWMGTNKRISAKPKARWAEQPGASEAIHRFIQSILLILSKEI